MFISPGREPEYGTAASGAVVNVLVTRNAGNAGGVVAAQSGAEPNLILIAGHLSQELGVKGGSGL